MNERKKLGIYIVQHDSQRSWKTFLIQVEVVVQELLSSPPLVVKRLSHLLDQISLTNLAKKICIFALVLKSGTTHVIYLL